MARRKKMTEDEIQQLCEQELQIALGNDSDKLTTQRSKAMDFYLGQPFGNERKDSSKVVTREVMNAVEWAMPQLIKYFAAGDETVRAEPETKEDVEEAQQTTDYLNYLLHKRNPGFSILYQWMKDGLLQKNGVVKAWYDVDESKRRESYAELTELELQTLIERDDIEIVEHEILQPAPGVTLFNVTVIRTGASSGLKIVNIPPEEFLISRRALSIPTSPFCAHVTRMTRSDLIADGYSKVKVKRAVQANSGGAALQFDSEYRARHDADGTGRQVGGEYTSADDSMTEVLVKECYIRADFDGDGIAELRKVTIAGDEVLENVEVDMMPFAGWTPIILSHKYNGLSMADQVMDLQEIKSQLFRNMLDNQYTMIHGRFTAIEGMVNMQDLLSSRPGGVIRTKMAGAVTRLDTPALGGEAFQMLAYVDSLAEKRTGISERQQGLDPNSLSPNTSAMATNQVMTAAQQRIELIARVFGETGLTDLFKLMHKLVVQNPIRDSFKLRDSFIEVDPSSWHDQTSMSVVVGLGNGSKETEQMALGQIFQHQMQLKSNPETAGLVQPINTYNLLEDTVKVFSKANAGKYFTDPSTPEAQQAAQAQQEQQMQMMQKQEALQAQQIELAQLELQIKDKTAEGKIANDAANTVIKQEDHKLDVKEQAERIALDTAKVAAEYTLEEEQGRPVALD